MFPICAGLADDSTEVEHPDIIEQCLEYGYATCSAFNRRGTLLASGLSDGRVVLWDFETRSMIKALGDRVDGPSNAVTNIRFGKLALSRVNYLVTLCARSMCRSWSRNGRFLLACTADGSFSVWNVADSCLIRRHKVASASHCQIHPIIPYVRR